MGKRKGRETQIFDIVSPQSRCDDSTEADGAGQNIILDFWVLFAREQFWWFREMQGSPRVVAGTLPDRAK
jgi:hypothetical protein